MTLFFFQVWKHNGRKQPCPTHRSLGSQSTNTLHLSSTFNRRRDHNCNWMPWRTNMSLGSFDRIRSEYLKCLLYVLDTRSFLRENNSPRVILALVIYFLWNMFWFKLLLCRLIICIIHQNWLLLVFGYFQLLYLP